MKHVGNTLRFHLHYFTGQGVTYAGGTVLNLPIATSHARRRRDAAERR